MSALRRAHTRRQTEAPTGGSLMRFPSRTLGALALAALSSAALAPAAARADGPHRPWGDASEVKRPHFIVQCNAGRDHRIATQYADFLEKNWSRLRGHELFKKHRWRYAGPSKVYIFAYGQEFLDITNTPPGVGGYFFAAGSLQFGAPEYDRLLATYHGSFTATGGTLHILAHEGTHQFQHGICEGDHDDWMVRPTWWVEGLATYFGDGVRFDRKGGTRVDIPRDRLAHLQALVRQRGLVPLRDLVRTPHALYDGFYYSQGWGLCYYLLHRGGQNKSAPVTIGKKKVDLFKALQQFSDAVILERAPEAAKKASLAEAGPDPRPAAEHYASKLEVALGVPWEDLQPDYEKFILSLKLPKLGKVVGNVFTSDAKAAGDLAVWLEAVKPADAKWRFDETSVQGDEAIRIDNAHTTGLVRVEVDGNGLEVDLEVAADEAEKRAAYWLDTPLFERREALDLPCGKAYELVYTGKERLPPDGPGGSRVREKEQRVRHVVIVTARRIYHVVCQADSDRFAENEAAFDEVLKKFKILPES